MGPIVGQFLNRFCDELQIIQPNCHFGSPSARSRQPVISCLGGYLVGVGFLSFFSKAVRKGSPVPTPPQNAIDNMKVRDALFRPEQSRSRETVA